MKIHKNSNPSFQFDREELEDHEVVELREGSVMYFPAGMWHSVECLEDSLSINLSLVSTSWGSLLTKGLQHLLWKDDKWREGVRGDNLEEARKKASLLLKDLKEKVGKLSAEDLLPPSVWLPRVKQIHLLHQVEEAPAEAESGLLRGKLVVLLSSEHFTKWNIDSQELQQYLLPEEELSERDEQGGEEKEVEEKGEEEKKEEEKGEKKKEEENVIHYFVNHNFGNEDLESEVRQVLIVPLHLKSVVDYFDSISEEKPVKWKQIISTFSDHQEIVLKKILNVLVHIGLTKIC